MKNEKTQTNDNVQERIGSLPSVRSCARLIVVVIALCAGMTCEITAQQTETFSSQTGQQTGISARFLGTLEAVHGTADTGLTRAMAVTATPPAPPILSFSPAAIGVDQAAAQQLTASFAVSGYSGSFTPTATLHYGQDYKIGAVTCTAGGGSETCNATVTFQPSLPGARKDAIFLMDGTTRLATVLLGGVGQGPLSLVQPGAFTTSVPTTNYLYQSVVDENGVVYILPNGNTPYIERVTKQGVATQIPLTNPPYFWTISIDGAGVLYLFNETSTVTTYDTIQGIQGTYQIPLAPQGADATNAWYPGALGVDGGIYVVNQIRNNGVAYALEPDGTPAYAVTFNPGVLQPFTAAVDGAGNFFVGGYEIDKVTPAGVQTQVNTVGASEGLAVDAADTLYATRYSPTDGVAELPASNYSTPIASIARSSPLGMSLGSDGTLYISNYVNLDIFDRLTTETVDFGEVDAGSTQTNSTATVYNGGNLPLSIDGFSLAEISDAGFSIDFNHANECTFSIVLGPGALCQASVVFAPTHAGTFSGTISVSTNSLNNPLANQTIHLTGTTYGSYDVLSPSPLVFAAQVPGTSKTLAVTMTNQGNYYASTLYSLKTDNPAFTIAQGTCAGVAIQVGATCQLQVTFSPSAVQSYTGNATIVTYVAGTAQAFQTITLPLSGSGVGPVAATPVIAPGTGSYTKSQQVTITDTTPSATIYYTTDGSTPSTGSTKYTDAVTVNSSETLKAIAAATDFSNSAVASASYTLTIPVLSHSPASLNFGTEPAGSTSTSMTVIVTNIGSTYAFNLAPAISNTAFAFASGSTCGSSVAPGASCLLKIDFAPSAVQAYSAAVTIAASSPGCAGCVFPSDSFTVTGSGIAQPPVLTISPATLNFGNQIVNTSSAPQSVTVTNSSKTDTVVVSSIGITSSPFFIQPSSCFTAITPGGSCTIPLIFTPGAIQTYSATVTVQVQPASCGGCISSYPAQTFTVTGTGIAQPPVLTLSPTSLNFGHQIVNTSSAPKSVTVTNSSKTDTVLLNSIAITASPFLIEPTTCTAPLAPGMSCTIPLIFTAATVDVYSATVTVQVLPAACGGCVRNYPEQTFTVTGTGIAQPPVLTFSPPSLNFGNQIVNTTATLQTTVTNIGKTDTIFLGGVFTTSSIALTADSPNCSSPLAPGMSCTVSVTFSPSAIQSFNGTVTLQPQPSGCGGCTRNYPAQTIAITGSSIAQPPVLAISPATLDFGNQIVNTTSARLPVTVTNTSATDTIALTTFVINSPGFSVNFSSCPPPLAPGASCTVYYAFIPSATQGYNAVASIQPVPYQCGGCVRNYPVGTFNLTGVGIAQPPVLAISPATLDFGKLIVNTSSAPLPVKVTNTSATDMIALTTFVINSPGFSVNFSSCAPPLSPGASCTVYYSFNPTTLKVYNAVASIQPVPFQCGGCVRNYPVGTFNLTGVGIAPIASLTPASMSFTSTASTTSASQTATLTNAGAGSLTILGISILGASPNDYSQTNNCGISLPVGANCIISVTFTPPAAGSYPATLTVSSDDTASPQTIALAGNGTTTPDFAIVSSTLPQTILPGGSAQYSLKVTAQNGATIPAVNLTASGLPPGATADFSRSTVTPGSTSATSTLTIHTSHTTVSSIAASWPLGAPVLALAGFFFFPARPRRRWATLGVLMIVSLGAFTVFSGCGGSNLPPVQSYDVAVTATIGAVQQSCTVQLTVR